MKANHNEELATSLIPEAVSNGSKILKWKQITTCVCVSVCICFPKIVNL